MKRVGLFVASVMLSTTLWAQSPIEKGLNVINKENAEAYIGFLASDELEGREAGFQGGRIAGDQEDRQEIRFVLPSPFLYFRN